VGWSSCCRHRHTVKRPSRALREGTGGVGNRPGRRPTCVGERGPVSSGPRHYRSLDAGDHLWSRPRGLAAVECVRSVERRLASLGVLVATFSIALPSSFSACSSGCWGACTSDPCLGWVGLRWTKHLRPWVMTEVFLVGSFVSYSRIKAVSTVTVEVGRLVTWLRRA